MGQSRGTEVLQSVAHARFATHRNKRPRSHGAYIWGLAAFAQQGAERVLDIINAEFRLAMVGCGTTTLKAITPANIVDTARRG